MKRNEEKINGETAVDIQKLFFILFFSHTLCRVLSTLFVDEKINRLLPGFVKEVHPLLPFVLPINLTFNYLAWKKDNSLVRSTGSSQLSFSNN